jgi:hypothetical protein
MAATARTLESRDTPTSAFRLVPGKDGRPDSALLHLLAGDALVLASLPLDGAHTPRLRTILRPEVRTGKERT